MWSGQSNGTSARSRVVFPVPRPPVNSNRIEETGSLRAAAQAMGLSYSKALRMVKRAEKELGFALTRKTIGGRGGGGSTLTDEARNFMERYEAYRDACVQTDRELYYKFFPGER